MSYLAGVVAGTDTVAAHVVASAVTHEARSRLGGVAKQEGKEGRGCGRQVGTTRLAAARATFEKSHCTPVSSRMANRKPKNGLNAAVARDFWGTRKRHSLPRSMHRVRTMPLHARISGRSPRRKTRRGLATRGSPQGSCTRSRTWTLSGCAVEFNKANTLWTSLRTWNKLERLTSTRERVYDK